MGRICYRKTSPSCNFKKQRVSTKETRTKKGNRLPNIDYESLSLEELIDIRQNIDREAHPDRYQEILRLIELHRQEPAPETSSETDSAIMRPSFTGSAEEYFRIWIVNILLSIVTLGIYSAWATVRNRRYLYGNMELDGARFDFHGEALAILKGRLIAIALFAAYAFGGDFHYSIPAIAMFILVIGFPWVIVSAIRFRLTNTSYRNLRFGSHATARQAYSALAGPILMLAVVYAAFFGLAVLFDGDELSGGFIMSMVFLVVAMFLLTLWVVPVLNFRGRNLIMNHVTYGDHAFRAELEQGLFFSAYFKTIGLIFAVAIAAVVAMFAVAWILIPILGAFDTNTSLIINLVVMYTIIVLIYLLPFAYWRVAVANHTISATSLEELRFKMSMDTWDYWLIMVTNALAAVFTLGLAIPWAKVRMLRYQLSCLSLEGELGEFTGSSGGNQTALGEEVGEAFDIDLGF